MLLYYKQIQCVSRTSQVHITRHAVDIKPPSEDSLYRSLSICCTIFYWNSCKLSIKCPRWIILWISGSHNVSLQRTKSQKCLHFYSLRILKCNENLAKKVQMRLSLHHPHNRNPLLRVHTQTTPTKLAITHQRPHSQTMMKMFCKSNGRSSTLMLIKPCYTVRAVCHRGPCESEQSLVTPSGIYQRFLVGGTVSFRQNSF